MKNKNFRFMISLLLLGLLFSNQVSGQTSLSQPGRIYQGSSPPVGIPTTSISINFVSSRDTYLDTVAGQAWKYRSVGWVINTGIKRVFGGSVGPAGPIGPQGLPGVNGINGASASVTVGTVTTLAPGSPVTIANVGTTTNAILNFGIPRGTTGNQGIQGPLGPQGPPGAPGGGGGDGGWIFNVFTSPDYYGAVHDSMTFTQAGLAQPYIDSAYAGTGAVIGDQIDWAALQMSLTEATTTGKCMILTGGLTNPYRINKSLYIPQFYANLDIRGNWGLIQAIGTGGTYPLITRIFPDTLIVGPDTLLPQKTAEAMLNSATRIANLHLKGGLNQIGIDIYTTYGCIYDNVRGFNLKTVVHARFALQTSFSYCYATNCTNGFIADMGNWVGASSSNSQSNHTTFTSCHYYGDGENAAGSIVGSAFQAIASSGCSFNDCIVEGASVVYGILIDTQGSSTVKTGYIKNCHVECNPGTTGAFIKWISAGGILSIDGIFGQYTGIMVDVEMPYGSYSTTILKNVVWWVPVNVLGVNKYYKSGNGATWQFIYNDQVTPALPTDISNQFVTTGGGVVPTYCASTLGGCGGNRYGVTYISR